MHIARMTARDVRQAHELLHSVIRSHPCYSPAARKAWEAFYTPALLRKQVNDRGCILLVARDGDRIVGFSNITDIHGGVADSDWTLVHPDYRGHKVGRMLMEAKFRECRKAGCHKIFTDSNCLNRPGEKLLEETGWKG